MPPDVTPTCKVVDVLLGLRERPMTAMKAALVYRMSDATAVRLLAYAEERGLLEVVGRSPRGAPVYGVKKGQT
jgi:Fic family protein